MNLEAIKEFLAKYNAIVLTPVRKKRTAFSDSPGEKF